MGDGQFQRYLRERDLEGFYRILKELGLEANDPHERGPEVLRRYLSEQGLFKVLFEHTCECGFKFNSDKVSMHHPTYTLCPACRTFTMWEWKVGYWMPSLEKEEDAND